MSPREELSIRYAAAFRAMQAAEKTVRDLCREYNDASRAGASHDELIALRPAIDTAVGVREAAEAAHAELEAAVFPRAVAS